MYMSIPTTHETSHMHNHLTLVGFIHILNMETSIQDALSLFHRRMEHVTLVHALLVMAKPTQLLHLKRARSE